MTTTTRGGLPVSINGHEYARDRGPYADPIGLQLWRRRWSCSCEQVGDWRLRSDEETHHDWLSHAMQAGWRREGGARGGAPTRKPAVPRSTDQRTDVPEGR
jgi:hypothetical protein